MKNELAGRSVKEETKRPKPTNSVPQLNMDPEKRRDIFNRLLQKYSTKSTKMSLTSPQSNSNQQSSKFPSIPPTKTPIRMKEKFLKKKKTNSDKNILKSFDGEDYGSIEGVEAWRNSVKCHMFDPSLYKNHIKIRNRFPFPLPGLEELDELEVLENSEPEESKKDDFPGAFNHSFTSLPCGDQKRRNKEVEVFCEENIADGKTDLPEELQYRHLTKTQSGTLVWVGNNVIHDMINKKTKKLAEDVSEKDWNTTKAVPEETAWIGEGEDRSSTKSGKFKKSKTKKNSHAIQESEDVKSNKVTTQESSKSSRPSSSSLPHLGQEEGKQVKKITDKVKKPKKLTKKQAFTLVTSKTTT